MFWTTRVTFECPQITGFEARIYELKTGSAREKTARIHRFFNDTFLGPIYPRDRYGDLGSMTTAAEIKRFANVLCERDPRWVAVKRRLVIRPSIHWMCGVHLEQSS